jgi:UDP-N-acetyl-D-mannosaminouronate:lipid I N-acetyl-D-mannosaminouronosyltransferase
MDIVQINGVNIYGFTSKEDLMKYISDKKGILVAVNAEKIIYATDKTREIINNNIGYADGLGAVVSLKNNGIRNAVRIPGCELWLNIISSHYKTNTFYFIGGKEETISLTISKLRQEFPGITILGYRNGYFKSEQDREKVIDDVVDKKPDYVFVAMGSPKQEFLMQDMQKKHNAVYQGLGGSFDIYCQKVKRAPKWWCEHKLEWLYRAITNPKGHGIRVMRLIPQIIRLRFMKATVFSSEIFRGGVRKLCTESIIQANISDFFIKYRSRGDIFANILLRGIANMSPFLFCVV